MPGDPFYNHPEWRSFRAEWLQLNSVCVVRGCGKRASYLDHIKSIKSGGGRLDPKNVQGLCHSDHSRKTVAVDGGFSNKLDGVPRGKPNCDAKGNPVDPAHHWHAGKARKARLSRTY